MFWAYNITLRIRTIDAKSMYMIIAWKVCVSHWGGATASTSVVEFGANNTYQLELIVLHARVYPWQQKKKKKSWHIKVWNVLG